ncbi:recombinase family protein [Streptomyces sp. NPDC012403]|uniref:recombinase family protein n=1 Tax=Streptomyces sp. NPDC012403 TaxID=3364831 RepID=UPI0036EF7C99
MSTEHQRKGYGIAYTGRRVVKHIADKGWALVDIVADEGSSGSLDHTQRPDVRELMRQARMTPRPFDVVTVYEDRAIGRKGRALWPWVWELQDLGVFTAVVVGGHDNATEEGESRIRKAADRAEDELIVIRNRTQGGIQEKAECMGHEGACLGGSVPYGRRVRQGREGRKPPGARRVRLRRRMYRPSRGRRPSPGSVPVRGHAVIRHDRRRSEQCRIPP